MDVLDSCSQCGSEGLYIEKFCPACGYPEKGTEEEQRNFRLRISSRNRLMNDAEKKIRTAKIILFVIAGLNVLVGVIMFFAQDDAATLIGGIFLGLVYIGLAAWANTNPFGAILTGLILYLTLWVGQIFIDPAFIYKGILIRIFLILALVKGIKSARDARDIQAQLQPGRQQ